MSPNMQNKKLEEAIVYIARTNLSEQLFGKIKLNKMLFFADANAFARLGASITGADYEKKQFGPVPRDMDQIIEALVSRGTVNVYAREMPDLSVQERVQPQREADLSVFTPQQIAILHEVMRWISPMTATETSELSHESVGWESARMGESIPIATALISRRMEPLDEEESTAALHLAQQVAREGIRPTV